MYYSACFLFRTSCPAKSNVTGKSELCVCVCGGGGLGVISQCQCHASTVFCTYIEQGVYRDSNTNGSSISSGIPPHAKGIQYV